MNNVSYAEATTDPVRLFDLRDTSRTSERFVGASPFRRLDDRRLIVHPEADLTFVEQYRRLGAALHHAQVKDGIRSVMVASAVGSEGKTLSATNLALLLSGSFKRRVLLVDGDLRKPSVHQLLQIENGRGLTDILTHADGRLTAQIVSPTLSVITGGHPAPDPVSLLVSDAAGRFLKEARDHFDWVVVDTPPVVLFPDAELFADRLDACVMVVNAANTSPAVAARAVATLGASRILGVVLNRAESTEIAAGYGYGQYGYPGSDGPRGYSAWWRSSGR